MQRLLMVSAVVIALSGQAVAATLDAGAELQYQLSRPMRVSVNVYDAKGEIVRSLLCGAPRKKGTQREFWDGLDQAGKPVPPGEYSWKVLAMPGRLKTEYLLTVGTNYPDPSPDPMQEAEHYRLVAPGTHGGPTAVAADESGIYIGAGCTENIENFLVKLSPDGKRRLWSKLQRVPWKGAVAMAKSGDRLLVLSANNEIWPYAAADGTDLPAIATSLPPADKDKPDEPGRHAGGLAANDREMVLCYPDRGLVRWCDPTDGKLLREAGGLEKPTAVAIGPDGTTYAICGTSILRLDRKASAHAKVVAGLSKPDRIALNKAGEILVHDAATEQVLRFTADGQRLAAYRTGRRPARRQLRSDRPGEFPAGVGGRRRPRWRVPGGGAEHRAAAGRLVRGRWPSRGGMVWRPCLGTVDRGRSRGSRHSVHAQLVELDHAAGGRPQKQGVAGARRSTTWTGWRMACCRATATRSCSACSATTGDSISPGAQLTRSSFGLTTPATAWCRS